MPNQENPKKLSEEDVTAYLKEQQEKAIKCMEEINVVLEKYGMVINVSNNISVIPK